MPLKFEVRDILRTLDQAVLENMLPVWDDGRMIMEEGHIALKDEMKFATRKYRAPFGAPFGDKARGKGARGCWPLICSPHWVQEAEPNYTHTLNLTNSTKHSIAHRRLPLSNRYRRKSRHMKLYQIENIRYHRNTLIDSSTYRRAGGHMQTHAHTFIHINQHTRALSHSPTNTNTYDTWRN